MSYLDEAAQDMAESFKRIFITAFGHGYDFGCESKEGECKRLEADNAKLRELVRDMYHCSDPCNDCPHYNGSNSGFYCGLGIGWKARRMRELGIEVDDA